jgi:hypothetical protein
MTNVRRTLGLAAVLLLAAALPGLAQEDKPLATAKQNDGLMVEILEVRPIKTETLLIRWRYRNPTGKPVQLIAATPRFASKNSPPNTAKKFWDSIYYTEGKFKTDKAYNCYILIERDSKKKIATDLGKDAVVVRPDQELELWAQFELPPHKDTNTITLSVMRTPLIKNIPIQSPDK